MASIRHVSTVRYVIINTYQCSMMGVIAGRNVVTYVTMAILFTINLLNYIDRYTVVGED